MTLNEFMIMLQKKVDAGYGDKPLLIEDIHQNLHIHSVQMNTCSGIEPDYLIIMAGSGAEY